MKKEAIKLLKLAEEICTEENIGVNESYRDVKVIVQVAQLLATLRK